jgi:SAM-dependent methyltransferase
MDRMADAHAMNPEGKGSEEFWEARYRGREQPSTGRPNPLLAEIAGPLRPGRALELGCALGDDANWLASRGWQVVGVDVSSDAVARAAARAEERGHADRVSFQRHDLAESFPVGTFDLITAVHFQSPVDFGRSAVLQRAAAAVAPGGLLLVIDHGIHPGKPEYEAPTTEELLAELALDPSAWETVRADTPAHERTHPDGEVVRLTDVVILLRRRTRAAAA